jgi:hypothetical protein
MFINSAQIQNLVPLAGINSLHKKQGATINQIVNQVRRHEKKAMDQLCKVAHMFKGNTEQETARNIWEFLHNQVPYKADGFKEQIIKLPAALIRQGGDCKSYALFTTAILNCLGIPSYYRLVRYNPAQMNAAHIYVITKNGVIIDAVYDHFNKEKPYFKKNDYKTMTALRSIGAQVGVMPTPANFIKEVINKGLKGASLTAPKQIGRALSYGRLSPLPVKLAMRGARLIFLYAFQNNWGNLATNYFKVSNGTRQKIKAIYESLGGNYYNVYLSARAGQNKAPITNARAAAQEVINDAKRKESDQSQELKKLWSRSKLGEPASATAAGAGTVAVIGAILTLIKYLNEETSLLEDVKATDFLEPKTTTSPTALPPGPQATSATKSPILPLGIAAALLLS